MPDAMLSVNGRRYGGWKSVRISLGMEEIAGGFDLSFTDKWPGQSEVWPILPGDECRVYIGETPVITGYVDDFNPSYDDASHSIQVTGRDKTGDLVDCSAIYKSGEWSNRKLDRIISDICAPFGITVLVETEVGSAFKKFAIQEGESAYETIERAARMRGVLLTSNGLGNLVLCRAGNETIKTSLVKGKNIESASGRFSIKDRFSKYIIKGQNPGDDNTSTSHNSATKAEATDSEIKRYRPLIVITDQGDGSTYKDRGAWERNVRAGRGGRVTYTVSGWEHGEGIWQPNKLVYVRDDYVGVADTLITARVTLLLDESGSRTELEVCRREAFEIINLPEKKRRHKGSELWAK